MLNNIESKKGLLSEERYLTVGVFKVGLSVIILFDLAAAHRCNA